MKVSQIIRTLKSQPELWTLTHSDDLVMVFEYQGYSFCKMTKQYGGEVRLVNKALGVEMEWTADDKVAEQLWDSVIGHYITNSIIN